MCYKRPPAENNTSVRKDFIQKVLVWPSRRECTQGLPADILVKTSFKKFKTILLQKCFLSNYYRKK